MKSVNSRFGCDTLEIKDVKVITPFYMEDERGYFLKSIEKDVFAQWDLKADIYETFETYSKKSVIRGLHFQTDNPQAKIVRVIKGKIRDVIVDLRYGSETFGKHVVVELSDCNRSIVWIPKGFAHGFEVVSEDALVSYTCIGKYSKESDTGIVWNDEALAINWITEEPIVSEKDSQLQTFEQFCSKYKGLIVSE